MPLMQTNAHDKQLLHVKEAAAALDVHPSTLRRRIHHGDLEAVRLCPGGRYRISREQLERFQIPTHEGANR
jgi:excisionase family DNA binding protein